MRRARKRNALMESAAEAGTRRSRVSARLHGARRLHVTHDGGRRCDDEDETGIALMSSFWALLAAGEGVDTKLHGTTTDQGIYGCYEFDCTCTYDGCVCYARYSGVLGLEWAATHHYPLYYLYIIRWACDSTTCMDSPLFGIQRVQNDHQQTANYTALNKPTPASHYIFTKKEII